MLATSCAWLIRRGRQQLRLGSPKAWSRGPRQSASHIPPGKLSQVPGPTCLCLMSEDFFSELQQAGSAVELIRLGESLKQGSLVTGA